MCIAFPCKLLQVDGVNGRAEAGSASVDVRLDLIEDPRPGDHVLVHAGFAIEKLDEEAAREMIDLLREAFSHE